MEPGEGATLVGAVDIRIAGQRAALSQVLQFLGLWIWCEEAWPGNDPTLIPYPSCTSPTSICQEKVLDLLTTENPPSPKTERAGILCP